MKIRNRRVFSQQAYFAFNEGNMLTVSVIEILKKYGADAHLWMPGEGYLNGFTAANYLEANASGAPQVVDQPVGYVGDAANVTLGAELVSNWDFSNGLTGWNAIGTGGSSQIVSGELELTGSGGAYPGRRITVTTVVGKTYQVTATARRGTTASPANVTVLGAGLAFSNTANETKTQIFTATGTSTNIDCSISSATATGTAYFDNISVREITGAIPATQSATSNKPILRRGHVNRIRNSTMQGAVVGTPGTQPTNWNYSSFSGINRAIVGKGTIDGLEYIDVRFWGTATAGTDTVVDPELSNGVSALPGQTWTFSVKCALVGGSWPSRVVELRLTERNSGGTGLATSGQDIRGLVTGSQLVSASVSRVFNQATTVYVSPNIRCPLQTGDSCDFTIRIAAPQLETGSVANSYVPKTTAAASSNTGGYWWEFGMEATPNDNFALTAPPFQVQDNFAIVSAFKASPNFSENKRIFGSTGGSAAIDLLVNHTTGTINAKIADSAGVTTWPSAPVGDTFNKNVVASVRKTGNAKAVRKDGVEAAPETTALGTSSIGVANIGATGGATTSFFSGAIYAVIAIKGTVSDADLRILEKWVGQQAGVQIA